MNRRGRGRGAIPRVVPRGGGRGSRGRSRDRHGPKREVQFGYKALESMLSNEPDNIVIDMTSERCLPATEQLLGSPDMRHDLLVLVVKVLGRASGCTTARSHLLQLLNLLPPSRFFSQHLSEFLNRLPVENRLSEDETIQFLQTIIAIFSELLRRLPSSYAKLPIPQLHMCTTMLATSERLRGIQADVEELMKLRSAKVEEVKKNAEQNARGNFRRNRDDASRLDNELPPDDFRQMSVIPTQGDVHITEAPFLRRNKVDGRYNDAEHYLDVQFRLLREDFVRPLRDGIRELLDRLGSAKLGALQDIRIYHKVRILYPVFTSKGLTFKIAFDVSRLKRVNWQNSKRLIFGSLLCLSKDNFETFILATVENRKLDELNEGQVDVFFHNRTANQINIGNDEYKMVETTAYFEAYRHVLKGLQEVEPETVPFQRYIVHCEREVEAPAYLRNRMRERVTFDLSPIVKGYQDPEKREHRRHGMNRLGARMSGLTLDENTAVERAKAVDILDMKSWPTARDLELDSSQLRAVQMALTKEFAVIQGPPGTGKTYIGLKVAKVLLHNKSKWDSGTELLNEDEDEDLPHAGLRRVRRNVQHQAVLRHRPVLVICYTNHALDQFLEGIHEFLPDGIIRVGGRSQSETMQKFSLSEFKYRMHKDKAAPPEIRRRFFEIHTELEGITRNMKQASENLQKCMESVVGEEEAYRAGGMTGKQLSSMRDRLIDPFSGVSTTDFAMPYWLGLVANAFNENHAPETNVPPVATFPFSEESGRQNQALQSRHQAAFVLTRNAPGVDGRPNGSTQLMGQVLASYIQIPNAEGFPLDTHLSMTIALHVYPEGDEGGPILCYHSNGYTGVQIRHDGMQGNKGILTVAFARRDLHPLLPLSRAVLNMNRWNYIATSYNYFTGMAHLWHDGRVVQEAYIGEGQLLATQFSVMLGSLRKPGQQTHFRGRVAGLNIFPEAISREQILNIAGITEEDLEKGLNQKEEEEEDQQNDFQYEADVMQGQRVLDGDQARVFGEQGNHRNRPQDPFAFVDKAFGAQGGGWQIPHEHRKKLKNKIKRNIKRELISTDMMSEEEARRIRDVWALPPRDRWRLYRRWVHRLCQDYRQTIELHQEEFERGTERLNEVKSMEDLSILRKATVIGMTTTGAAKYRNLIQEIKPRITIVEEAAEVLESHIVTSLSPGCQHLILIGDHQQLRPNPTVYRLAKDYHLDVSLFERMVTNGMPFERLRKQHRMRPEIAEMLKGIYDDLENHESVLHFEKVKGVSTNMYFINHQEMEEFIDEGRSRSNIHEAKFLAALCRYFILQGYDRSKITVLTMYTGQLIQLKKEMPKDFFAGVRVCAVDNFQGEENDIILLSLVRSNEEGKIGFLRTSNRVCVALSRAKKGFYCIGNMSLMAEKERLWADIINDMRRKGKVGEHLTLTCQNHPKNTIKASKAEHFRKAPEGGCMEPCNYRLACGHVCKMICHPTDPEHEEYQCREKCTKVLCKDGHRCPRFCFQECGPCSVQLSKIIPKCGHLQKVPCHMDPSMFACTEPCKTILKCGHPCNEKCGAQKCTEKCLVKIEKEWPCGHKIEERCHVDPALTPCRAPCNATLKCEHACRGNCTGCMQGRIHRGCFSDCGRTLFCGHACPEPCTKNCPPCKKTCENKCVHSECKRECGVPCVKCAMPCTWRCPHYQCQKLCGEPCDRPRCNAPCEKVLPCGHPCIGLCGETCPKKCRICDEEEVTAILFGHEDEPKARFVELEGCGHVIEVSALDHWMDGEGDTEDENRKTDVQLKRCPMCKTPIRTNLRYGNVIKAILQDFEKIKEKMILSKLKQKEVAKRIDKTLKEILPHTRFIEDVANLSKYLEQKTLTTEQLNVFENQANFLKMLHKLIERIESELTLPMPSGLVKHMKVRSKRKKTISDLSTAVYTLKTRVMRASARFSDQELEEMNEEMLRMVLLVSFKVLLTQLVTAEKPIGPKSKAWMDIIEHALDSGKVIEPSKRNTYTEKLDKIRKKYLPSVRYQPITEEEKTMVVKAMGFAQGHWFKCPKGHIYAIGDCGGATVESDCPECGSRIGGGSHRLRDDNTLASEMDGARHPAWGNMVNLGNFDLEGLM